MPQAPEQQARELLADQVATQGAAYRNLAGLIRGGFVNMWITPALAVIAALVVQLPGDEE